MQRQWCLRDRVNEACPLVGAGDGDRDRPVSPHFGCAEIEAASAVAGSKVDVARIRMVWGFFRMKVFLPFFFVRFLLFGVIVARIGIGASFLTIPEVR